MLEALGFTEDRQDATTRDTEVAREAKSLESLAMLANSGQSCRSCFVIARDAEMLQAFAKGNNRSNFRIVRTFSARKVARLQCVKNNPEIVQGLADFTVAEASQIGAVEIDQVCSASLQERQQNKLLETIQLSN